MEIGEKEARIVEALRELGKATANEVARHAGLKKDAVNRLALWMKIKGLVDWEEREREIFTFTEEAMDYEKNGLPEKKLIKEVNSGIGEINVLKGKMKNFSIALGWAKRKGWVDVRNGKLILTESGKEAVEKKSEVERAIESRNPSIALEELKRRNLVRVKKVKDKSFFLTEKGKRVKLEVKKDYSYDVTMPVPKVIAGRRHPYERFLDQIREKLTNMGFVEMEGPLVELEFWNFDALFQPQNHAARDWTSTYRLKKPKKGRLGDVNLLNRVRRAHEDGWGYKWNPEMAMRLMPRAHGTCLSARTLAKGPDIPGKYFAIARCFRPDVMDATHLIEFNQVEGIIIGKCLTFRNLLGVLKRFAEEIAGAKRIRFFPDYYPFTEPSVQMSAYHEDMGWVEFGGAGIFRREMCNALGVKEPVLAWGLGIDRLAMFKLNVSDIRYLFSTNIEWLRNSKEVVI